MKMFKQSNTVSYYYADFWPTNPHKLTVLLCRWQSLSQQLNEPYRNRIQPAGAADCVTYWYLPVISSVKHNTYFLDMLINKHQRKSIIFIRQTQLTALVINYESWLDYRIVLFVKQLAACLISRKHGFNLRHIHVGYVVDKVALRMTVSKSFGFPRQYFSSVVPRAFIQLSLTL